MSIPPIPAPVPVPVPPLPPAPEALHAELRTLIAASRQRVAGAVNAELTRLYWAVGDRLAREVLGGERAGYGQQLVKRLGEQLAQEFGRGFEARNLHRMVQFAQAFPDHGIVSTLSTQLSWSHFVEVLAVRAPAARQFYAEKDGITVAEYWTELPPKAELESRLHQMLVEARERLAQRGVLLERFNE